MDKGLEGGEKKLIYNLLAKLKYPRRPDNLSLINFVFLFLFKWDLVLPRTGINKST